MLACRRVDDDAVTALDDPPVSVVRRLPALGEVERALVRVDGVSAERWTVPLIERPVWDLAVAAAAQARSAHVRAPLDVAIASDGTLRILFPVLAGPTLEELLATDGWLTPGRAVTMLCPIADAISVAHDAGVTLGGVSLTGIRADARGAPVIHAISQARSASPLPAQLRSKDPAHREDAECFAALCTDVRAALEAAGHSDAAHSMPDADQVLAQPSRLQHWAEAEPLLVTLSSAAPTAAERASVPPLALPSRPADRGQVADGPSVNERPGRAAAAASARVLGLLALPAELVTGVTITVERASERAASLVGRARGVSRRQLVVGAAGLAVVGALVVTAALGGSEGADSSAAAPVASPSPQTAPTDGDEQGSSVSAGGAADDEGAGAAQPEALVEPNPEDWGPTARELVARWQHCRRDVRVICDEAVHQMAALGGRAADEVDAMVTALASMLESPASSVTVVERAGDVARLTIAAPDMTAASLLVVRSEAGWRIRDAWN